MLRAARQFPSESPLSPSRRERFLKTFMRFCPCQHRETGMTYNLTTELKRRERATYAAAIKQACKEISACKCPDRRWLALRVLRVLQDRIKEGN